MLTVVVRLFVVVLSPLLFPVQAGFAVITVIIRIVRVGEVTVVTVVVLIAVFVSLLLVLLILPFPALRDFGDIAMRGNLPFVTYFVVLVVFLLPV